MKISIIGAGAVGSTIAYTLMVKKLASEILLVDINKEKEEGEVWDISDGLSFSEIENINAGNFSDTKDSDIIILTAGLAQKPDETRIDLVKKNKEIVKSIMKEIGAIQSNCIILVISNPVDILTYLVQELSGLPHNQVFGTGTTLDTARLRLLLSKHFNIDSRQIDGFVLGEHGDSEFVAWSTVNIEGKEVSDLLSSEEMDQIQKNVKDRAYQIINRKGATFYGIAMVTADIIEAIIYNQHKILPVSSRVNNNDISNVCLGTPNIIGGGGIIKDWPIELNDNEKSKLINSATTIKKYI